MLNRKSVHQNLLRVMLKSAKETRQMEQAMAKSKISPKEQIQVCNYQSIHLRVFWVQYGRWCQFHTQTVSSFVRSQQLVVDLHSAMYEQNCNSTNDLDLRLLKMEKTKHYIPTKWWWNMVIYYGWKCDWTTNKRWRGWWTKWFSGFNPLIFSFPAGSF